MERRNLPEVRERTDTLRHALHTALRTGEFSIRELSHHLSASERELVEHLEHLERSLAHTSERLVVEPARCLGCGFRFEKRDRLKKPGRCPSCKATRITLPRFAIVSK